MLHITHFVREIALYVVPPVNGTLHYAIFAQSGVMREQGWSGLSSKMPETLAPAFWPPTLPGMLHANPSALCWVKEKSRRRAGQGKCLLATLDVLIWPYCPESNPQAATLSARG